MALLSDDTMARHEDRERVSSNGPSHRSTGALPANLRPHIAIAHHAPMRDREEGFPDGLLERRSLLRQVQRDVKHRALSIEVGAELFHRLFHETKPLPRWITERSLKPRSGKLVSPGASAGCGSRPSPKVDGENPAGAGHDDDPIRREPPGLESDPSKGPIHESQSIKKKKKWLTESMEFTE